MNKDCSIVKDLLALYSEDMVSEETAQFVSNHLKDCESCTKEYENLKKEESFDLKKDIAPLKDIKKKIVKKRIATAFLSVFLVLTVLITGYALLSTREYVKYDSSLMTVNERIKAVSIESSDGSIVGYSFASTCPQDIKPNEDVVGMSLIIFDERVTDCSYYFTYEPETDTHSGTDGGWVCHIEAWTTLWDRLTDVFGEKLGKDRPSQTLLIKGHPIYSIYYSQNDGQDEVHVRGSNQFNGVALPRLSLNYYIVAAAGLFAVLLVLLLILRKKEKIRKALTYFLFVPLSYIVSSLAVMGFDATTYSFMRDFKLILLVAILILCVLIAAYRIICVKKEIKEINKNN